MPTRGVMMRPVHQAALSVPNILAEKGDRITFLQIVDAWSKLDVVLDKDGLPGREAHNKSLVG